MNEDNPILILFENLLDNKEEINLMKLIIQEKSNEEIIELLLKGVKG